jgi:choline dehydrogenase
MGDDWTVDWGYASEPDADGGTTKLRRGRVLGGTSWLTRFAVRGAPADFDAWAARGNPGWSFDEVLPAFRRLETDAEFGGRPWHGDGGPIHISRYPTLPRSEIHRAGIAALEALGFAAVGDLNAPGPVGVGPMPMSTRAGRRITTLDAYLPSELALETLTIRTDSLIDRVILDRDRATGVRLADGAELGAGRVVISAGTYGSPLLLLRSGIGPETHLRETGVAVRVALPGVGENLADHPATSVDSGWRGDGLAAGAPVLHSLGAFRSAEALPDGAPDLLFWLTDPSGPDSTFDLDPVLMKPASRGRVRLRSSDPAAMPRISLPSLTEARDVDRLGEGYRLALEVANHPEIRALASNPPPTVPTSKDDLVQRVREGAYSVPHVVGTCRMGPDSAGGDVVDAVGRVHGIDNLHVVDASIIPDAPSGFPHIITIMAAEHIAERLR